MTKKTLHILGILVLYEVIIFFYGRVWLGDLLPPGDFAGGVTVVAELKDLLSQGSFGNWSMLRFGGCPNTLLWSFLDWWAYVPFALWFSPVMAVKVAALFYFGLAGAAMFALAWHFTRKSLLSFWAGLAYMLSPIFMFSVARAGHTNFPPFYAAQPLVFWTLWRLVSQPQKSRLALAALAVMLAVWIDTERAFTALPVMFILTAIMALYQSPVISTGGVLRYLGRQTAWLSGAAALAFLLGAFFLLPAMIESRHIALFGEKVLQDSRAIFGLNNPLYLLDRNGWLVGKLAGYLPGRDCYDAGNYYLGLSTMLIAAAVCLTRRAGDHRVHFAKVALVGSICLIWIASGASSIYANLSSQMIKLYQHLEYGREHPYLLPSVALIIIGVIVFFGWLRIKRGCSQISPLRIALISGLALTVLYVPVFPLLAHLPMYAHMRNPGFFMSVLPPLLLVLVGLWMLHYFTDKWPVRRYTSLILAVIMLTIIDYYPYRAYFHRQVPLKLVADFQAASSAMKQSPMAGSYLSRESYRPLADMHTVYADRDTAWYWLNWSCPKATHRLFMGQIYRQLHHPDTIEHALALAGLFNVRFATYDLTEGPLPPETPSLRALFSGDHYAVFENLLCRDYAQLYLLDANNPLPITLSDLLARSPSAAKMSLTESATDDQIIVNVDADRPGLLLLSQSSYPGWSVKIDGRPAKLRTFEGVLPAVMIEPGSHHVTFSYRRPWYFYGAALISLITAALTIRLLWQPNRYAPL